MKCLRSKKRKSALNITTCCHLGAGDTRLEAALVVASEAVRRWNHLRMMWLAVGDTESEEINGREEAVGQEGVV